MILKERNLTNNQLIEKLIEIFSNFIFQNLLKKLENKECIFLTNK
jgi:hypothetical protein